MQQIAGQWKSAFRLHWQVRHEGQSFALAGLLDGSPAVWHDHLVFIDGSLACRVTEDIEGVDFYWASQPDGLAYLAGRLKSACGLPGGSAPRRLTDASVPVPFGPIHIQELPSEMNPVTQGFLGSLVISAGLVLSPIALGVGLPAVAVGNAKGAATDAKRAEVALGQSWDEARATVGDPIINLLLPGSSTEVRAYVRGDWSVSSAGDWYVGVRDGEVAWTCGRDDWLRGLVDREVAAHQ